MKTIYILMGTDGECGMMIKGYPTEERAKAEAAKRNGDIEAHQKYTKGHCRYRGKDDPFDPTYEDFEDYEADINHCNNCPYKEIHNDSCKNQDLGSFISHYYVCRVEVED